MKHNQESITSNFLLFELFTKGILRKIQANEAHYLPKAHQHFLPVFSHLLTVSKKISIGYNSHTLQKLFVRSLVGGQ